MSRPVPSGGLLTARALHGRMDDSTGPRREPPDLGDRWDDVLADARATARGYREDGWTVHEVYPGDVTPLVEEDDLPALDVVLPDDEFTTVRRVVAEADRSFETCEVFRAGDGSVLFLVVVERDDPTRTAVLYPAYYDTARATGFVRAAAEADAVAVHLRALSPDERVTFTHDDPSLFRPEG